MLTGFAMLIVAIVYLGGYALYFIYLALKGIVSLLSIRLTAFLLAVGASVYLWRSDYIDTLAFVACVVIAFNFFAISAAVAEERRARKYSQQEFTEGEPPVYEVVERYVAPKAEPRKRDGSTTAVDIFDAAKELKQAETALLRLLNRQERLEFINGETPEKLKAWRSTKQARALEYDIEQAQRRYDKLEAFIKECGDKV